MTNDGGSFLEMIRIATIRMVLVFTLVVQMGSAVAFADDPAKHDATIRRWIEQLDSEHFHVRRSAHAKLVEAGKPARDLLRDVSDERSLETKERAKTILREMLGQGVVLYLPEEMNNMVSTNQDDAGLSPLEKHSLRLPDAGPVVVRDTAKLDTDDQFTIMAWIRPSEIRYRVWLGDPDQQAEKLYPWGQKDTAWEGHFIACKWRSVGQNGDYIFAVTPSGRLGLGVGNREARQFVTDSLFSQRSIEPDRWTHVAASFRRGRICLYIDGQLDSTKRSEVILNTDRSEYPHDDVYIGDFWNPSIIGGHPAYRFEGDIAELCVFDRMLDKSRIQYVMNMTR